MNLVLVSGVCATISTKFCAIYVFLWLSTASRAIPFCFDYIPSILMTELSSNRTYILQKLHCLSLFVKMLLACKWNER